MVRGFLLLLAVDIWVNVLAEIQLSSGSELYIGAMTLGSLAAFVGAITSPRRWLKVITFVTFAFGLLISQPESGEHRDLITLILLSFIFIDTRPDADVETNWGGVPLCAALGAFYVIDAIEKTQPAWISGDALESMLGSKILGSKGEVLLSAWQLTGESAEAFWQMASYGVVAAQVLVGLAFTSIVVRETAGVFFKALIVTGFVAGVGLYVAGEWYFSLAWFNYYMLFLVVVLMGPRAPLEVVSRLITRLSSRIREELEPVITLNLAIVVGVTAALVVLMTTMSVGLPGITAAGIIAALVVLGGCVVVARSPEHQLTLVGQSTAAAFAAMGIAVLMAVS
jgi:hypothetical protein